MAMIPDSGLHSPLTAILPTHLLCFEEGTLKEYFANGTFFKCGL